MINFRHHDQQDPVYYNGIVSTAHGQSLPLSSHRYQLDTRVLVAVPAVKFNRMRICRIVDIPGLCFFREIVGCTLLVVSAWCSMYIHVQYEGHKLLLHRPVHVYR